MNLNDNGIKLETWHYFDDMISLKILIIFYWMRNHTETFLYMIFLTKL